MRMFVGHAVGEGCVVGATFVVGQVGFELSLFPCDGGCSYCAVDLDHVVCHQIMQTIARALVGISDRATMLQPPITRGADGPINAAGTGRCGGHDAGVFDVEAAGYLYDKYNVLSA